VILYLYALVDRHVDLEGLSGVAAEALRLIDAPKARVIAGRIDAVPVVDRATLETQDRLVRALHGRTDALLPMRFGTALNDDEAVRRAIEIIAADLPARFDQVRGKEQMTVRVLRTRPVGAKGALGAEHTGPPIDVGLGTKYLQQKAQADLPPEIAPLRDALRDLARATRIETGSGDLVATVYQLIDRGAGNEFSQRVTAAASRMPTLTLRVSGPAPPYAFA
jgi:gas vesicle protein GvpL/GvpF